MSTGATATLRRRHARPANRPCTHRAYLLTCDEYEELLDATGNRCQTCGIAAARTARGVLSIDHESLLGLWAVRGLLCQPCNVRIEWPHLAGSREAAYLTKPWYRMLLDRAGISGTELPEPPLGTRVRAGDVMYERVEGGWQSWRGKIRPPLLSWRRLCYNKGPHRLIRHG